MLAIYGGDPRHDQRYPLHECQDWTSTRYFICCLLHLFERVQHREKHKSRCNIFNNWNSRWNAHSLFSMENDLKDEKQFFESNYKHFLFYSTHFAQLISCDGKESQLDLFEWHLKFVGTDAPK